MNYCGLICEYNPFHTGHLYQLNAIKSDARVEGIVAALSGPFVQRAEPAIVSKFIRTKIALSMGVDAVIQIPTAHTITGGERFATSALDILASINGLKYLAFGCETLRFDLLIKLSEIRAKENTLFKDTLAKSNKLGLSYPNSLTHATLAVAESLALDLPECRQILDKPNNILAIEYLKTIYQKNHQIEPIFIHRADNYNSLSTHEQFASASALRAAFTSRVDHSDIASYLPYKTSIISENIVNYQLFEEFLLLALRTARLDSLADAGEGIDNKLHENALKYTSLSEVLNNTKSKRYTYSRLKRIALEALLGVTKELITASPRAYGKLLGIKEQLKAHLSDFSKLIIKFKDAENLPSDLKSLMQIDILSDNIYSQLTSTKAGTFFGEKLIVV